MTQPKVRVLSLPGKNYRGNNYFLLFCEGLEKSNLEVVNIRSAEALTFRFDLLHIHFPEHHVTEKNSAKAVICATLFSIFLTVARLLGKPIVWTVHDVTPFNIRHEWLLWPLLRLVRSLTKGYVFLNDSSRVDFLALYPNEASKPTCRIMHGPYKAKLLSDDQRLELRQQILADRGNVLAAYLGDIKPYKNIRSLLKLPALTADGRKIEILVAGKTDPAIREHETDVIIQSATQNRVVRLKERLSDTRLEGLIQASDFVVLPYTRGSNSGFAMLVLSCHGRILTSGLPMFRDLSKLVGRPWTYVTDFEKNSDEIKKVIAEVTADKPTAQDVERLDRFLSESSFENGGAKLAGFYSVFLNAANSQKKATTDRLREDRIRDEASIIADDSTGLIARPADRE